MDTVLQSRSRTVTIAIDKPFCIIGERINPTGRKAFAAELRNGNLDQVIERVKQAADPREEAFELAVEQARHALAQPGVRGLHLISFRKDDAVGRLCERLGIPPTKERDASGHGSAVAV